MAVSNIPMVIGDGSVTISTAALSFTVDFEQGNFTAGNRIAERRVIYDRDEIVSVRKGRRPVAGGSFTVHAREFTNGSADTIMDVAEFSGNWSAAVAKKTSVTGDHNFVDLAFTAAKAALGDTANAVLTYSDAILVWDFAEGEPAGSITVTWEAYGTVTRTGQA